MTLFTLDQALLYNNNNNQVYSVQTFSFTEEQHVNASTFTGRKISPVAVRDVYP